MTLSNIVISSNRHVVFQTKKLPKSTLFGVDFNTAAQGSPDGIPTLVKKCVVEIDSRALDIKVRKACHVV